ncbi:MAG: hypothetical protein U1F50_01170 [Rubrivivax sp.]
MSPLANSAAPFCAGFAFRKGDVPAGQSVVSTLSNFQVSAKNTWPDGSLKLAIVAGRAPLEAGVPLAVDLRVSAASARAALDLAALKATGVAADVACGSYGTVSWAGTDWDAPFKAWIAGPEMSSWIYRKPVGSDPHLVAWLEVRLYAGGAVEVLPWIENGYLKVPGASSKSATFTFRLGGSQRFSQAIALASHCRTVLLSGSAVSHWYGTDPQVAVRHDASYLQSTGLVPSYRASVPASSSVITQLPATFTPLQQGSLPSAMGSAGYHPSIGLLPEWDVLYLVSSATAPCKAVQFNAYSAGRYGVHFRDENTHRPLRFSSWPNLCLADGGTDNVASKGQSATGETTVASIGPVYPEQWEGTHHPSIGFTAYLVSGRWYFMEESQFVATLNYLKQGSTQRQGSAGIFKSFTGASTTRGMAWQNRSLLQAACITPDDDPLRAEFLASVQANVEFLHARYVAQPNNPFGWITPYTDYTEPVSATTGAGSTSTAVQIPNGTSGTDGWYIGWTLTIGGQTRTVSAYDATAKVATVSSPFTVSTASAAFTIQNNAYFEASWQQDFVTGTFGYGIALEVAASDTVRRKLVEFFAWKAQSVIGRFGGTAAAEWLYRDAAPYTVAIALSDKPDFDTGTGPWYASWGAAYDATWKQYGSPGARTDGDLRGGYFPSSTSYWGNLQPALAYAVQHGVSGASAAYARMKGAANWPQLVSDMNSTPVWSVKPLGE